MPNVVKLNKYTINIRFYRKLLVTKEIYLSYRHAICTQLIEPCKIEYFESSLRKGFHLEIDFLFKFIRFISYRYLPFYNRHTKAIMPKAGKIDLLKKDNTEVLQSASHK